MKTEGIDVVRYGNGDNYVHWNNGHNKGMAIPTKNDFVKTSVSIDVNGNQIKIPVYSILSKENMDGNYLIYALKNLYGYKIKTIDKHNLWNDVINKRLKIFFDKYNFGSYLLAPSRGSINNFFFGCIRSRIFEKLRPLKGRNEAIKVFSSKDFIQASMNKKSASDIYFDCADENGYFAKYWGGSFQSRLEEITPFFHDMYMNHDDKFSLHYIHNQELRKSIESFLEWQEGSDYSDNINGKDVLVIDDIITYGSTIKNICYLLYRDYKPRSVTVLTLISKDQSDKEERDLLHYARIDAGHNVVRRKKDKEMADARSECDDAQEIGPLRPFREISESKKMNKNIFLTENQVKDLQDKLNEDTLTIKTKHPIDTEKVLIIKNYLDKGFKRGNIDSIGDDGYPYSIPIVAMLSPVGEVMKNLTDVQLFYLLQDRFKSLYADTSIRDKFLKQLIKDWYSKKITPEGLLSVNMF